MDKLAFPSHFYGHTGEAYRQNLADNGITRSIKIRELEFDGQGKLSEGCMLILEVEQQKGDKLFTLSPVPFAGGIAGSIGRCWDGRSASRR